MEMCELIVNTENQISLLKDLVKSHTRDLKTYPKESESLISLAKLEHCYNTLLSLNDLLVK